MRNPFIDAEAAVDERELEDSEDESDDGKLPPPTMITIHRP